MWGWSFLVLFSVLVWQAWKFGPRQGLGVAIFLSLLVPTWAVLGYEQYPRGWQGFGEAIDMRTAISFIGLLIYSCRPKATFRTRLVIVDYAMLGLLSVHVVSDSVNEGFSFLIPLRAFAEWGLPYLCGRLAIQSVDDVRHLLPYAVIVVSVFGLFATLQSLLGLHIWEWVYHATPMEYARGSTNRGLRSWGPAGNPIYFGTMQLLLLPWAIYAVWRVKRGAGPQWWYASPAASVAGICFTISRAPILGIAITAFVSVLILKPRWRPIMIGFSVVGACVLIWQRETVIELLESTFQDEGRRFVKEKVFDEEIRVKVDQKVTIAGEQVRKTNARTRIYLFQTYQPFMSRAGWLGFGTKPVSFFPIRIPEVPNSEQIVSQIPFVDNNYILIQIRFGYLGTICFVTLGIATLVNYVRLALRQREGRGFNASMAGAFVATMLVMLTVWMPRDFGFIYLFSAGASAGMFANYGISKTASLDKPSVRH